MNNQQWKMNNESASKIFRICSGRVDFSPLTFDISSTDLRLIERQDDSEACARLIGRF
jgi:hypothetical protein